MMLKIKNKIVESYDEALANYHLQLKMNKHKGCLFIYDDNFLREFQKEKSGIGWDCKMAQMVQMTLESGLECKIIDKKNQEVAMDNYRTGIMDNSKFKGCLFVFDDKLMEDHQSMSYIFSDYPQYYVK